MTKPTNWVLRSAKTYQPGPPRRLIFKVLIHRCMAVPKIASKMTSLRKHSHDSCSRKASFILNECAYLDAILPSIVSAILNKLSALCAK